MPRDYCVICHSPHRVEIDFYIHDHPELAQREVADWANQEFGADLEVRLQKQHISFHKIHMVPLENYKRLMSLAYQGAEELVEELWTKAQTAEDPLDKLLFLQLMEQALYIGRNGPDAKITLQTVSLLKHKDREDPVKALRELLRGVLVPGSQTEVIVGQATATTPSDGPGPVAGDGRPRLQLPAIPKREEAAGTDVAGPGGLQRPGDEANQPAEPGELVGED